MIVYLFVHLPRPVSLPKPPSVPLRLFSASGPSLLVKLDIVGGEETRVAAVVTEPPVLIGELQVGNRSILRETQFCHKS